MVLWVVLQDLALVFNASEKSETFQIEYANVVLRINILERRKVLIALPPMLLHY